MKIMILGSEGYMGWPTSVNQCSQGHEILMIDNNIKKSLMRKHKRKPLVNQKSINDRLLYLKKRFKNKVTFSNIDCSNLNKLESVFKKFKPDTVIHYAELPSAPYSMIGSKEGWLTLENNLKSTFNLISCVKKYNKDCHVIKLGTMGEYGTPNIDIEEGWLSVKHNKRIDKFMYPRQGSSLYHTSKIMDTDLLWFYVRLYELRVTDLMQGPVYGIYYSDNDDSKYLPTFSYDDIFGTVLNRFIVQAVVGIPLTIYGTGQQIRGYINLKDSLKCINLAIKNPAKKGQMEIYNQFTEQYSVNQIAKKVRNALSKININVKLQKISNPRIERNKHYYNARNDKMKKLGLNAELLDESTIVEIAEYVMKHKANIDKKFIKPRMKW